MRPLVRRARASRASSRASRAASRSMLAWSPLDARRMPRLGSESRFRRMPPRRPVSQPRAARTMAVARRTPRPRRRLRRAPAFRIRPGTAARTPRQRRQQRFASRRGGGLGRGGSRNGCGLHRHGLGRDRGGGLVGSGRGGRLHPLGDVIEHLLEERRRRVFFLTARRNFGFLIGVFEIARRAACLLDGIADHRGNDVITEATFPWTVVVHDVAEP
jgi:hypothetical protein